MTGATVFPYLQKSPGGGAVTLAPLLPARLAAGPVTIDVTALVDSGADLSVLPFDVGSRFGFDWNALPNQVMLGGVAAGIPGKLVPLVTTIGSFRPVVLVFAWARSNSVRLVFGQTNFFQEFDVCFYRSKLEFYVRPKTP
jgi:hypothetical protein